MERRVGGGGGGGLWIRACAHTVARTGRLQRDRVMTAVSSCVNVSECVQYFLEGERGACLFYRTRTHTRLFVRTRARTNTRTHTRLHCARAGRSRSARASRRLWSSRANPAASGRGPLRWCVCVRALGGQASFATRPTRTNMVCVCVRMFVFCVCASRGSVSSTHRSIQPLTYSHTCRPTLISMM